MKTALTAIILSLVISAFAEDPEAKPPRYSFKAGYYGNNVYNPGLVVGADFVLWEKEKYRKKLFNRKEKIYRGKRQWIADADAGFFIDPRTFTGSFVTCGLLTKRSYRNLFNTHWGFSPLSFFHSAFPETYTIDESGKVKKAFLPGRNYYAPTFTWGIGKEIAKKKIDAWYLDLDMMILLPYNTLLMPLFSLEFGYRFDLNFD